MSWMRWSRRGRMGIIRVYRALIYVGLMCIQHCVVYFRASFCLSVHLHSVITRESLTFQRPQLIQVPDKMAGKIIAVRKANSRQAVSSYLLPLLLRRQTLHLRRCNDEDSNSSQPDATNEREPQRGVI